MRIFVDIDQTICDTIGTDYAKSIPIYEKINKINTYYDKGHEIIYWTARGSGSNNKENLFNLTKDQLNKWGVKYDELRLGKPIYDLFICDKSVHPDNLKELEI